MKTFELLKRHAQQIKQLVSAHNARNPKVFGSVLHGDDTNESDVDILVEPLPNMSLFDLGAIQYGLSDLLGKRVDVLTPNALPERFRDEVLAEAAQL